MLPWKGGFYRTGRDLSIIVTLSFYFGFMIFFFKKVFGSYTDFGNGSFVTGVGIREG